jgi:hypothetical protein
MGGAVNLDLPFDEKDPEALDACLAEIDRELDELFLAAVGGELERLRLERLQAQDDAAA